MPKMKELTLEEREHLAMVDEMEQKELILERFHDPNAPWVYVKFKKANGEIREMVCTTHKDAIPVDKWPKGKKEPNPDVMCVWDQQKQDWRAFRFDSVLTFN